VIAKMMNATESCFLPECAAEEFLFNWDMRVSFLP
jgi:hypothetical protein